MSTLIENPDFVYVLYTGLALGVFLAFTGMAQMLKRGENSTEAKSRRMRMIAKGNSTAELLAVLKPGDTGGALNNLPFIGDLPKALLQAGFTIKPMAFLSLCGAIFLMVLLMAMQFLGAPESLLAAVSIGLILPVLVVKSRQSQNTALLIHQLPDALDLMARGLRVGHPLNVSIGSVGEEMPDPIGTEFGIIFDQVSFGDDLADAFQEFAERVDLEDVHYLSASIGIQHGTGSDLARVLEVLSRVIRNRIALRRKIQAISSEGRMTAWFLSALPIIIYTMTSITSPNYYAGVSKDPMFMPMAVAIITLTILNALILRKLVNFRI